MSANVKVGTPSKSLDKHRRSQSLTLPSPTQPQNLVWEPREARPQHIRKSSKWDSEPLLQNLRHTLKRVLPGWGSRASYEKLALDLYITAVGLSGACRIRNFLLSYDETVVFAIELAKIINTSDLLLVLDSVSDQLLVIHTHILMTRLENPDETVFLRRKEGRFASCRCEVLHVFEAPFEFFRNVLRQSSAQVVRASEFGWSPLETSCYMESLCSWLMEHPVVIYRPVNGSPIGSLAGSSASLAVHFEGCDASYDHSLETFFIPRDILGADDSTIGQSQAAQSLAGNRLSLSAIQDSIQSLMFERLNSNESILFADVSCEVAAAHKSNNHRHNSTRAPF